ncbi:hypothetical protein [Bacillus sp. S/N-304-OC-R1]|uniref:hypothetical protein n=1 Tax=Bacillus sp. S/N-304-OC-R1 TaxID=2758034 RepID=UPI001C8E68AC|nr:hypothetical protein [Bacillus sp. S/N-304-OC-R1]MBY0122548.1 hypothetical protein [Bacillus sp. S/N-304-OC-R1]
MKRSEWTDDQIEELLGQMPRITDNRDPREIYHNISLKLNKRKQRMWVMPSVATAGAFILFFILVPNLFDWNGGKENSMELANNSSTASEMAIEKRSFDEAEHQNTSLIDERQPSTKMAEIDKNQKMGITSIENVDQSTAVYEEDLAGNEVLTYAIPDDTVQFIVPVSIIVPKEDNKTKFDLFKENMESLREQEWGLNDYFPLKANLDFEEENKILTVDVQADHPYSISSNSEWLLNQVLNYTMSTLDIKKVRLTTDGNNGIDFSHMGQINEFVYSDQPGDDAYYFYFPNKSESKPFIVPFKFSDKQSTIAEAFAVMRNSQKGERLVASIPSTIQFDIEDNPDENKLVIRFANDTILNNDESTLHTLEAILLTAKEFNYDVVKLENVNIDRIGRFDLTHEIKVPVAPNKREYTH